MSTHIVPFPATPGCLFLHEKTVRSRRGEDLWDPLLIFDQMRGSAGDDIKSGRERFLPGAFDLSADPRVFIAFKSVQAEEVVGTNLEVEDSGHGAVTLDQSRVASAPEATAGKPVKDPWNRRVCPPDHPGPYGRNHQGPIGKNMRSEVHFIQLTSSPLNTVTAAPAMMTRSCSIRTRTCPPRGEA